MVSPNTVKKNPHGPAQECFIKQTRAKVTLDPLFFEKNDWTSGSFSDGVRNTGLNRSGGSPVISVDQFHVKDVAVWIPHRIVKNHTPSCPGCGTSENLFSQLRLGLAVQQCCVDSESTSVLTSTASATCNPNAKEAASVAAIPSRWNWMAPVHWAHLISTSPRGAQWTRSHRVTL